MQFRATCSEVVFEVLTALVMNSQSPLLEYNDMYFVEGPSTFRRNTSLAITFMWFLAWLKMEVSYYPETSADFQ
jgi:hypothetical protein